MKNSQKAFIVPLLIIIAVLVIGAGIYVYAQSKIQSPTEQAVGQPYPNNSLEDCMAGKLDQPPVYCFEFTLPPSTTFQGVMNSCLALPDNQYVTDLGPYEKASWYPSNFSYQEYCVSHLASDIIEPQRNYPSTDFQKKFFPNFVLPDFSISVYNTIDYAFQAKVCTNYGVVTNSPSKSDRCLLFSFLNRMTIKPGVTDTDNQVSIFCGALSSESLSSQCKNVKPLSIDTAISSNSKKVVVPPVITSWTTYVSSTLGISFNYPASWTQPAYVGPDTGLNQLTFKDGLFVNIGFRDSYANKWITLNDYLNLQNTTGASGYSSKTGSITVNGKNYTTVTSLSYGQVVENSVIIPNPNSATNFVIFDDGGKIDAKTFNSIVSSFKFIGP